MISSEYIAGFFDGEGCVTIMFSGKTRQAQLRITITNTDKNVLDEIQKEVGGRVYPVRGKTIPTHWKQGYHLDLSTDTAYKLLKRIEPFVIVKRNQVQLGIRFQEFYVSPGRLENFTNSYGSISRKRSEKTILTEQRFKEQMTVLNKKGRDIQDAVSI